MKSLFSSPSLRFLACVLLVQQLTTTTMAAAISTPEYSPPLSSVIACSAPWLCYTRYDGASNMTASGPEFYVFDAVSRLVEATFGSGSGQRYAFDAFGNMTSITTTTGGVPSTRAIGVSASTNRLTSAVYDAAGNVTSWNGNAYEYDAVSMMTSLNGSKLYVYDADDMRVMLFDSAQGEERWRLRGLGQEVLRENVRTATGWQWSRDYVFRDGEMLASISAENGTRHQHPNHLGTPRVITDANGLIVASQLLRPFGEEASGSGAVTGFLKFTGHERDFNGSSATNHLDYMRARFYSPHLGRFLSPDPKSSAKIANPQSWNRYAYALNNPLKFVDPDGQESLAALRLEMDIQSVASGEMSSSEFQERNKARAAGVAAAGSLFVPGPEDAALAIAARTRLGSSIASRIGNFLKRVFKSDAASDGAGSARNLDVVLEPVTGLGTARARIQFRGQPNSILRGGDVARGPNAGTQRAFVTDEEGRIVREITRDRVKVRISNVSPSGQTFETFEKVGTPTAEDIRILEMLQ